MNKTTKILFTTLVCGILVGCISLTSEVRKTQARDLSLGTVAPTVSFTSTPTPANTCLQSAGKITPIELPASSTKYPLAIKVYTPPCFDEDKGKTYPLLILFHGQSSTYDHIIDLGLPAIIDGMIKDDPRNSMIIVFPQEKNSHIDLDKSDFGDQIVVDLIPWLKSNYPLMTEPKYFGVGGISRGGGWAFRFGIDHPELFGSIGAFSPAFDGRDVAKLPDLRRKYNDKKLPRIYMDIGFQDSLKNSARNVELKLSTLSIPHEWHMNKGTHNADYWSAHLGDYLKWYSNYWVGLQISN